MPTSKYIVLLPKSPVPEKGRVGKQKQQDWFHGVSKALAIWRGNPGAKIIVPAGFQAADCESDAEVYKRMLWEAGDDAIIGAMSSTTETVGQLTRTFYSINKIDAPHSVVWVVASILHMPRVWWICWRLLRRWRTKPTIHYVMVGGRPRPQEAITDIILTFAYPILDLLGMSGWFVKKLSQRRDDGKL